MCANIEENNGWLAWIEEHAGGRSVPVRKRLGIPQKRLAGTLALPYIALLSVLALGGLISFWEGERPREPRPVLDQSNQTESRFPSRIGADLLERCHYFSSTPLVAANRPSRSVLSDSGANGNWITRLSLWER